MSGEKIKERMNKLRQVKDVVFKNEECCPNLMGKIGQMIKDNPNDSDLGNVIRKFYLEEMK